MTDPTEAIRKAHALVSNEEWINGNDEDSDYSLVGPHDGGIVSRPFVRVHSTAIADYIAACNPAAIRALLDRLDSAERDQRRYQWLRGNVGEISTSAFEDMQFYGEPGDTQDALRLDAAIDAALRAGEQKEPK